MSFSFRPAIRENVPLLIGLAGGTGSGKTFSAMRLAKGLAGGKRFAVIDTEAGRAKHYADAFAFDHGDISAPFEPKTYLEAIQAADREHYPVIIVDSMSHEWAGDGGILDMQEAELQAKGGGGEAKMSSWIRPKHEHKRMVSKLLQVRAHLILCFRAEPKIDMVKDPQTNKTVIVPKAGPGGFKGWLPVCEKNLPYELTMSFLLMAEAPGFPEPIKLEAQHRAFFADGSPIDERAGEMLAEWARGGAPKSEPSLKELMTERGLTVRDLNPILGGTATSETLRDFLDRWLGDNEDKTIVDLCNLALARKQEQGQQALV